MPDRDDEELYNIRTQAAKLLTEGRTIMQTAVECGVSERTIARWVSSDGYIRSTMVERQQLTLDALAVALSECGLEAVDVLRNIMLSDDTAAGVRVKAAGEILEHLVLINEHSTMARRLLDVEKRLGLIHDTQSALIDSIPEAQQLLLTNVANEEKQ